VVRAVAELRLGYVVAQAFGRFVLFPPLFRLDIQGMDQLPRKGTCVLVSNHISNFDPLITGSHLPRYGKFVAKRELFRSLLFGWLYRVCGVVPVRRDGMDMPAVRNLLRTLRAGGMIVMYPEGTRSRNRVLQHARAGTAYLALKTGSLIVPMAIWGTERFSWRRRLRGRVPVHMRFGSPFRLPPAEGKVDATTVAAMGDLIMRRIASLLPSEYHGAYAEPGQSARSDGG
jgi:1-acyl-sn-glycerol-3-phosphate acyltransferase